LERSSDGQALRIRSGWWNSPRYETSSLALHDRQQAPGDRVQFTLGGERLNSGEKGGERIAQFVGQEPAPRLLAAAPIPASWEHLTDLRGDTTTGLPPAQIPR
jgi:hypothetical protein